MAIVASPVSSRLQLKVVVGYDSDNNPILQTRTYSNIKPDAASDLLYLTGQELASLQEHPLAEVRRVDELELKEEPAGQ